MTQVYHDIWTQIAREEKLASRWSERMFTLPTPDALHSALDDEYYFWLNKGYARKAISAYLIFMPLLIENEAISNFIVTHERLDLRGALPEIIDIEEAIYYAELDYRLNQEEVKQFKMLLQQAILEATPSIDPNVVSKASDFCLDNFEQDRYGFVEIVQHYVSHQGPINRGELRALKAVYCALWAISTDRIVNKMDTPFNVRDVDISTF